MLLGIGSVHAPRPLKRRSPADAQAAVLLDADGASSKSFGATGPLSPLVYLCRNQRYATQFQVLVSQVLTLCMCDARREPS